MVVVVVVDEGPGVVVVVVAGGWVVIVVHGRFTRGTAVGHFVLASTGAGREAASETLRRATIRTHTDSVRFTEK